MQNETATETDVMFDLLAIVDETPVGRLVGSEETTIEFVGPGAGREFILGLNNGQVFKVRVTEVQS